MIRYKLGGVRLPVSRFPVTFELDVGDGAAHPTLDVFISTVLCLLAGSRPCRDGRGDRRRRRRFARGFVSRSHMAGTGRMPGESYLETTDRKDVCCLF